MKRSIQSYFDIKTLEGEYVFDLKKPILFLILLSSFSCVGIIKAVEEDGFLDGPEDVLLMQAPVERTSIAEQLEIIANKEGPCIPCIFCCCCSYFCIGCLKLF